MDNSLPAVYFQSECNERCDVKNKDEKISSETISPLIALGHELFHAYHYIMGSYYNDINMQASINHNEECNAVEEYITAGINFKSYDGHMLDRKFYDNIMCENGLRIEQAKATGNPLYLRVSLKSYSSEDL